MMVVIKDCFKPIPEHYGEPLDLAQLLQRLKVHRTFQKCRHHWDVPTESEAFVGVSAVKAPSRGPLATHLFGDVSHLEVEDDLMGLPGSIAFNAAGPKLKASSTTPNAISLKPRATPFATAGKNFMNHLCGADSLDALGLAQDDVGVRRPCRWFGER